MTNQECESADKSPFVTDPTKKATSFMMWPFFFVTGSEAPSPFGTKDQNSNERRTSKDWVAQELQFLSTLLALDSCSMSKYILGGIAAFYLINKGLNVIRDASKELADAIRWRSYYKCGREDPLAPHYERRTSDPESRKDGGNPPKKDISNDPKERFLKGVADGITTSATKAINEAFSKAEEPKTADFGPLNGNLRTNYKNTFYSDHLCPEILDDFRFITADQFSTENIKYDKIGLEWYINENVIIDEFDQVLAWLNIQKLADEKGKLISDDENPIYLRDDLHCADYEIVVRHDHYLNALETSQVTDDKSNNQEKE